MCSLCRCMRDEFIFRVFEEPVGEKDAQSVIDGLCVRDQMEARDIAVKRYGFAVPCIEAIRVLVSLSPLVEVGAGSGLWSRLVREAGGDIVATDKFGVERDGFSKMWSGEAIERMEASEAVRAFPECNVFVSWPSYCGKWAAEMAALIRPGRSLVVIGEDRGGCTADDDFFDLLDSGYEEVGLLRIPRWPGICDMLTVHVRKG